MTEKTMRERCDGTGLRMQVTFLQDVKPPVWGRGMTARRCTIRHPEGRTMTVTFWMGVAHGDRRPDIEEVLDCLCTDAVLVEGHEDAIDFARSMGMPVELSAEVREAESNWRALVGQTDRLRRLLGEEYSEYLYETEGL